MATRPRAPARNRNALLYDPEMAVARYLDPGVARLGEQPIPTTPGPGGGGFVPAPDTGGGVVAPPAAVSGGGGGGGGGGMGGNLLASVAGALLDPRVWKAAESLLGGAPAAEGLTGFDQLGNPLDAPPMPPQVGTPQPVTDVDQLGNPVGAPVVGVWPSGLDPLGTPFFGAPLGPPTGVAAPVPGIDPLGNFGGGAPTGTVTSTSGGTAALDVSPAMRGDAGAGGTGLLGGGVNTTINNAMAELTGIGDIGGLLSWSDIANAGAGIGANMLLNDMYGPRDLSPESRAWMSGLGALGSAVGAYFLGPVGGFLGGLLGGMGGTRIGPPPTVGPNFGAQFTVDPAAGGFALGGFGADNHPDNAAMREVARDFGTGFAGDVMGLAAERGFGANPAAAGQGFVVGNFSGVPAGWDSPPGYFYGMDAVVPSPEQVGAMPFGTDLNAPWWESWSPARRGLWSLAMAQPDTPVAQLMAPLGPNPGAMPAGQAMQEFAFHDLVRRGLLTPGGQPVSLPQPDAMSGADYAQMFAEDPTLGAGN